MRMRSLLPLLALLVGGALANPALAADPRIYELAAPLDAASATEGAAAVRLPIEVLVYVRSSADMRIVDAKGGEVPFYLHAWDSRRKVLQHELGVYNSSVQPGENQSFELTLPPEIPEIESLELRIEGQNYNREVDLYGRNPGESYRLIKEGMRVVSLSSNESKLQYAYRMLEFPPQRVREYKVVVRFLHDTEALKIPAVVVRQTSLEPAQTLPVSISVEQAAPDSDALKMMPHASSRSSWYVLVPEPARAPLEQLSLSILGQSYARRATLYAYPSGAARIPYSVASEVVFAFHKEKQSTLFFPVQRAERYLLELYHGDDRPVELAGASGTVHAWDARFFIEPAVHPLPYRLLFKASAAHAPEYDIQAKIARLRPGRFQPVTVGPTASNPEFDAMVTLPKTERGPYVLYAGVGLLVLVLLWWLNSLIKGDDPEDRVG